MVGAREHLSEQAQEHRERADQPEHDAQERQGRLDEVFPVGLGQDLEDLGDLEDDREAAGEEGAEERQQPEASEQVDRFGAVLVQLRRRMAL